MSLFSGTGTRFKTIFGRTKSSDTISELLSKYLYTPEFTLQEFVQEYSAIIEKKKNPYTVTTLTDKVTNYSDRMKYLTKEVASQVTMLTSVNDCSSPSLQKINALRELEPDAPGGEFGVIFDKYLQLQIELHGSEKLNDIKGCLMPMHDPDLWDKQGLGPFYSMTGGRRKTRRRRSKRSRKTRSTS